MFNYFKNRRLRKQNLIKNILNFINDLNLNYTYYQVGMSRKNYNLLTGNYFDSIGNTFIDKFQNQNFMIAASSFGFYKLCNSIYINEKICDDTEDRILYLHTYIGHKKIKMLTDDEFLIKNIIK